MFSALSFTQKQKTTFKFIEKKVQHFFIKCLYEHTFHLIKLN